jgi:hypothetical protein
MEVLGDGLVDVTLISLNSAGAKQVDARLRARGGIQYVSLDDSDAGKQRFQQFLPAADIVHMEADAAIPGLRQAANIIEIPWMMVTHKDAPDDLVYAVTKTIAENQAALGDSFAAFKRASVENMAPAHAVAYHPGALRYYQETNSKAEE